ncbi:MAG: cytochrome C oxidase subunit IV family protein [Vicinamibacterales bacterium]|nr:cytochrome C oxidase subunit IV family protein [Vicinamibacterales bacterium]
MYRIYWIAWSVLLALTLVMVVLDQMPIPRQTFVALMLGAMTIKASLIAGYFMHLRFERWPLVVGIILGLPINAAILYILIVPDALRIFGMTSGR